VTELDDWIVVACAELGLNPADSQTDLVLQLAKVVAHGVVRPAAPVTAYLLGLAVAAGADPAQASARLGALVDAQTSSPTT